MGATLGWDVGVVGFTVGGDVGVVGFAVGWGVGEAVRFTAPEPEPTAAR